MNEKSISSISKSSQSLEDKVTSLAIKIPEIDAAIVDIKTEISYFNQTTYSDIKALKDLISSVNNRVIQLEADLPSLSSKVISQILPEIEDLKSVIDEIQYGLSKYPSFILSEQNINFILRRE